MSNGTETDTQNNDGNGTTGNKVGSGLLAVAAAAAAAAVIAIGNKLFGPRSVLLTVANQTAKPLRRIPSADHHESGGFAALPALEIAPFSSDTFGSQNTDFLQGAIGSVTYAGDGITLLVGWHNARIGVNKTNHTLDGINRSRYVVVRETGSGDEKAQMLYGIGIHPDYHVRPSLAARGQPDLSAGIQAAASVLGKSTRPISVRDLVDF